MQIALTGDVMLGRLVDQYVIQNQSIGPDKIWSDVLPLMLKADRRLINLECVISGRGREWQPDSKAFHFRAHPRAIEFLRAAKIDCVTLANNHVLDYGTDALVECLALLDQAGIKRTGAGSSLVEALTPAIVDLPQGRLGVVSLTDNQPEWEAGEKNPGTHYIAYDAKGLVEPYRSRFAQVLKQIRSQADLVVVSAHVGPNWGPPSAAMRMLAHQIIDLGVDLYWGHSNHTPQGIELYQGKAILYSAGDFLDDYAVDSAERNDLSFLFLLELERGRIARIFLHPVCIEDLYVRLAKNNEVEFLSRTMQAKCKAFGTTMEVEGQVGTINVK
ncbi:MAG: CapA family protein [Nitrospirae bacterium]|nr:CapA family protein [Nitrospirota bacterium]MDE3049660.1 CapA family protein [Nitrospirota bacterium]